MSAWRREALAGEGLGRHAFGLAGVQDAETRRLLAVGVETDTLDREAAPQQFANGGGSARHAADEPPIVQYPDFLGAQHDLQALGPAQIGHGSPLFINGSYLVRLGK